MPGQWRRNSCSTRSAEIHAGNPPAKLQKYFWTPYIPFSPPTDHGDDIVRRLQDWLADRYAVASPVQDLVRRSGLPERTLKRRFTRATGLPPITYVQHLRLPVFPLPVQ